MSKATFLAAFTISVLRGRSAISLKSISNSSEIWICWVAIDHRSSINGKVPTQLLSWKKKQSSPGSFPWLKACDLLSRQGHSPGLRQEKPTDPHSDGYTQIDFILIPSKLRHWLTLKIKSTMTRPTTNLVAPHSRPWVAIVASSNMRRPRTSASLHRHKVPPA